MFGLSANTLNISVISEIHNKLDKLKHYACGLYTVWASWGIKSSL